MALANSLLYELTNNSVERSIELIQLALHSPVYIPQKREIIVSWLCRRLETHKSLKEIEAATLWDILRGLVKDMQPLEVAVVVQDSFLQAIQQQLEELSKISYEECLLETMTALIQKAPQNTLVLKLPALVKLLAVTLKQCRHFMLVPEKFEHLCLTAAALMEVFISSWYQHSCTIQEAFVHLKPLLPDMMYLLHMKKDSSSEAVHKLHRSIKRFVHTSLFLRNNITEWLTALYEYLRLDGFNAHVPLKKGDQYGKEVMEAGDDEMEGEDVKVNQEMVAVLQAEPHRLATVNKDEGFLLEKLMEFFAEVWKDTNFPKKPAADFLPEFFSVFLEGLISFNKTEDLQSNTVLLAYFAHHLGMESPAFSGTVPFEMGLTTQQRLRHLCGLLCTYQATEQYCLVVVMPQFKRSLFKPRRWFGELAARLQPLGDEERCTAWFHCLGAVMRIAPNLVEGSMIKTLRKCWEVCSTKDPNTLEARDRLLESILNTYIELFRIPKLIRNIFSSFTSLCLPLAPSSVPVSFLRRFAACCIDLSPGQLTETWSALVNQLKYWTSGDTAEGSAEIMDQGEPEWQAGTRKLVKKPKKEEEEEDHLPKVLVVTEILYTFACHVQLVNPTMPSSHVAKVTELMQATSELATQMVDFAIEKQSVQHAQCALSVFHVWGELHLVLCLYRRTYGEAYAAPELTEPLEAADLSFLHPAFTRGKLKSVMALLSKDKTKLICHYLMLLWIQKIRALILFTEATNEHLAPSLEATAKLIFSHVDMTVNTAAWSQRVCEVSAGVFPVVSLHTLLVNFPLLAPHLPAKNVTALCHFLLEVMANGRGKDAAQSGGNGLTQTKVVTTFLGSQAFLECKLAQTAYVTALWGSVSNMFKAKKRKLDSDEGPKELCRSVIDAVCGPVKWDKYAETVPQPDYSSKELLGPEGLNKMWTAIHGASEKLTAVMAAGPEERTERIDVVDVLFMLEALEHLPLESLFPGNQLRCMLGLLSVLFLLEGMLRKKDNFKEKLQTVKCTARTFCLLLQSPRKSWLLDFVSAGTLISRLVAAFQGNLSQALDDRSMLELYDNILNTLVHHALKKKNTVRTLNSIVKQMKDVISTDSSLPSKAHATAALVLFKELVLELCRKMLHADVKGYIQKMAHTLSEGIAVWLEQLLGCTKLSAELREQMYTIALLQTQYAQCAGRLKPDGDDEEGCSKNTLAALSMVTAELQKPEASEVADTLIEVVSRVARQRARTSELLPAAFPALGKGIYMQLALRATQRAEASSDGKAALTLENCISDKHCKLMEAFFQSCTAVELKDILADLVSTLMQDDVRSVSMKVHLQVLQLVCSCLDGQKQGGSARDAMPIIHRIIEHFAVMLSVYDIGSHPELVVYILKFFSTLLTMRKIVLSHRGGIVILQSLSSLNFLPLWASSPEHFCQAVTAACRLLSIFLSKRIVMVVGCTVAFQTCISHLLRSIIKVGGSDQLKDQPLVAYELHMSALSLERLVGEVASHKKEFSKVGGFLIPDYIQESITTVLHPPIKKTLLFLVYKLFSLPDEHRRAMVHATLPKEATEVFKTLFADSQKLRFKGKV